MTKQKKRVIKRKRTVRLYTDYPTDYDTVEFTDAKWTIPVPITMTSASIVGAKKGKPFNCILANAIMYFAAAFPDLFPHPVLYAYVQRSAVYLVTKRTKGKISHAVRYMHSFSTMTHTFDKITAAQFEVIFKGLGFTLNLNPGRPFRGGEATTDAEHDPPRASRYGRLRSLPCGVRYVGAADPAD